LHAVPTAELMAVLLEALEELREPEQVARQPVDSRAR
jgi:hypothetical protein